MAHMDTSPDHPNYYFGLNPKDLGEKHYESNFGPHLANQIPFHRFTPASILDGVTLFERRRSQRGLVLNQVMRKIIELELPGEAYALEYLRHLYRRNCKANTIKNACINLYIFLKFLKHRKIEHLEQITRRDMEAFVEHEQDRGLQGNTIRFRIHALYAFFRFLLPQKVINPDILLRKIRIKLPQLLPRAIAPTDIIKLLDVIDNTRNRAMILMLLRTGIRIGELLNLKINDVDLEERTVKIYMGEKNSIGRMVYLSDDAAQALGNWLKIRDPKRSNLFYAHGKRQMGYSAAREMFARYREKAGLANKRYTLHCLRHTCATDLLNAGMRLECLQQLLGHTKIEVTRIYARLTDKTREKEYFKAMAKIEKGEVDEHYQLDCQL